MLITQPKDVTKLQYSKKLAKILTVANMAYNSFMISEIECKVKWI